MYLLPHSERIEAARRATAVEYRQELRQLMQLRFFEAEDEEE